MLGSVPSPMSSSKPWNTNARVKSRNPNPSVLISSSANLSFSRLSTVPPHPRLSLCIHNVGPAHFFPLKVSSSSSSSAGTAEYQEEPTTHVKFQTSLSLPGCSSSLSLLGTGYREKVFAIIGVKVYAAALYINRSILSALTAWKAQPAAEIQENSAIFGSIFQAPSEKSLQIVLVRNIDGKTFWAALDDTVSPRIKTPTSVDESALSKFRSIFQDRPLKKGTFIFLTWLDPSKMQVCVSSNGIPSAVDATIESANVTSALFDVFFGNAPVSPSLKASVANGLARILK